MVTLPGMLITDWYASAIGHEFGLEGTQAVEQYMESTMWGVPGFGIAAMAGFVIGVPLSVVALLRAGLVLQVFAEHRAVGLEAGDVDVGEFVRDDVQLASQRGLARQPDQQGVVHPGLPTSVQRTASLRAPDALPSQAGHPSADPAGSPKPARSGCPLQAPCQKKWLMKSSC